MSKKTYFDKLKDPRWQEKRLEVMQRNNFCCEWCGSKEFTLHVHHGYYTRGKEPWDYGADTLYSICEHCHNYAEDFKHDLHLEIARIHPKYHSQLFYRVSEFKDQIEEGKIPVMQCDWTEKPKEISPEALVCEDPEMTYEELGEYLDNDTVINKFIPDMRKEGRTDKEIEDMLFSLWHDLNYSHADIIERMIVIDKATNVFGDIESKSKKRKKESEEKN